MYCKNCGKEIDNNLEDSGSIWWGVLGCCVPIVGLVLYIVWKDTKPKCGKKAGIGAIIGFVLGILITIIIYLFVFYVFAVIGEMGGMY